MNSILVIIMCMLLITYILIHLQPRYYKNLYPPSSFYSQTWLGNDSAIHSKLYRLEVYKSRSNDYMLVLYPQAFHFFVETRQLIYHGRDVKNEHYDCPPSYQLAYTINVSSSKVPKFVCHKNIEYLQKYVYTEKVYTKPFPTLQNPLAVINSFFLTIQKIQGVRMMITKK